MVGVLLVILFLCLLSVGLWAYSRMMLTSAAAGAARYAANLDVPDAAAAERARSLLGSGPGSSTSETVTCTSRRSGLVVEVTCRMTAPGLVSWLDGVMPDITVTGHAFKEST